MAPSHLTLSDLERSKSMILDSYIFKGAKRGHMLLQNVNRKQNAESPIAQSDLTLGDLDGSKSRLLRN